MLTTKSGTTLLLDTQVKIALSQLGLESYYESRHVHIMIYYGFANMVHQEALIEREWPWPKTQKPEPTPDGSFQD